MISEFKLLREIARQRAEWTKQFNTENCDYVSGRLAEIDAIEKIVRSIAHKNHETTLNFRYMLNPWTKAKLYRAIQSAACYLRLYNTKGAVRVLNAVLEQEGSGPKKVLEKTNA